MSTQLTLQPSQQQISVDTEETILEALLRHGFQAAHSCKNGACGTCKSKLLSGKVEHKPYTNTALSTTELENNWILTCCALPQSDVHIHYQDAPHNAIRTLPCRVQHIDKISNDVVVLRLTLPSNLSFNFSAGQYIDIHTKDGQKRSFSIANPPLGDNYLDLHIRLVAGGKFSEYVFNNLQEKEILRFTGPLGNFFLREDSDKPLIFVASGTGFAPIKSILEYAFSKNIQRRIYLYWGVYSLAHLYMPKLPQQWQQQHQHFSFIPVLSEPKAEDQWQGRCGFVHQAVLDDFSDLSAYQVYACGAPIMVESAHRTFTQRGLAEDDFFSDAFFLAKDRFP